MDSNQMIDALYREATGCGASRIEPLAGAGSNRRYFRVYPPDDATDCPVLIATCGTSKEENEAFCYLSGHLSSRGIEVPRVVARSADGMTYLQTDLGRTSLFDVIMPCADSGEWPDEVLRVLEDTVRRLPHLQWEGGRGMDFSRCHPVAAMDRRAVIWDLNYFKYSFLKLLDLDFSESRLEDAFEALATLTAADAVTTTFMMRDCQSRNVMLTPSPAFIDFQGGRRGPAAYDLASLLWQARARIPAWVKARMVDAYLDEMQSIPEARAADATEFRSRMRLYVLLRILQTLGAYGFRGLFERKAHFVESIPAAISQLRQEIADPYPDSRLEYLYDVLGRVCAHPRFAPECDSYEGLTVRVQSFGFRKSGIPDDASGNGGGFVFDCRALHNPGRYDEFKPLTGMDGPVREFLHTQSEADSFVDEAAAMVCRAVDVYRRRGFRHLSVGFGCTGGRHRSVYCAEAMGRLLAERYPDVRVEVSHREQNIHHTYNGKR